MSRIIDLDTAEGWKAACADVVPSEDVQRLVDVAWAVSNMLETCAEAELTELDATAVMVGCQVRLDRALRKFETRREQYLKTIGEQKKDKKAVAA